MGDALEAATVVVCQSLGSEVSLLCREKLCARNAVWQPDKGYDARNNSLNVYKSAIMMSDFINQRQKAHQQPFNNKNPSPPLQPSPRPNRRQSPRQKPPKGPRQRRRRVKDADAQGQLAARVHARKIQHDAWEQAALGDAQQGAHGGEAAKGADEAEAHGDDSPGDGERGQPDARGEFLEDEVAGEFAGKRVSLVALEVFMSWRRTRQCRWRKRRRGLVSTGCQ